jgi:N-terminal domain of oxidoreductase
VSQRSNRSCLRPARRGYRPGRTSAWRKRRCLSCRRGGLLLRVLYLSLDSYMRGRMDDRKSYAKPVGLDEVMTGEGVCEVIASEQAGYAVGDTVLAQTGWRTHAASAGAPCASSIRPWHRSPPASAFLACPVSCLCGSQPDWEAEIRRNSRRGSRKWTRWFTGLTTREACWRDSGRRRRAGARRGNESLAARVGKKNRVPQVQNKCEKWTCYHRSIRRTRFPVPFKPFPVPRKKFPVLWLGSLSRSH